MILCENQSIGVARTTSCLQQSHSPAQHRPNLPSGVLGSRAARPRDVITRTPKASLGSSGASALASTAAVSGAFPLVAPGALFRAVGPPRSHRLSVSVTARWQQAWPLPRGASFSSGPCPGRAASRRVRRLLAEAAPEAAAAAAAPLLVVPEAGAGPRASKTFVSTRR